MIKIDLREGLPFVEATLTHNSKTIVLRNVLIDTGSCSTVISGDIAQMLGLGPELNDIINAIQGVGGTELVYEKRINAIGLYESVVNDFDIQVGAMNYGFEIDAILGFDFLNAASIVIDTGNLVLYTSRK